MTKHQLNNIYYLTKELEAMRQRLDELNADIALAPKVYDGMPHSQTNTVKSPVEEKAVKLAELSKKIDERIKELEKAKLDLEILIADMTDPVLKLAILYHCIKLYDWNKTAAKIGGNQTSEGVRKMYSRFVSTLEEGA